MTVPRRQLIDPETPTELPHCFCMLTARPPLRRGPRVWKRLFLPKRQVRKANTRASFMLRRGDQRLRSDE